MEIYTPTPDRHNQGDSIVVESYEEENEVIYVGVVRQIGTNTLKTSIPMEAFGEKWDIVSSKEEREKWQSRFENSQYEMYMKAEANNSGDISISGV
jgi:hypothetical protein